MDMFIYAVQENLRLLGLYDGKVDGIYGPRTRSAIRDFQYRYYVNGSADTNTLTAVRDSVKAWTERKMNILLNVPTSMKEVEEEFGKIEYVNAEGGYVKITNKWDRENIVLADLPLVGKKQIHRKLVAILTSVFQEIVNKGLSSEIHDCGTYCPRHIMHNPHKGLSLHSYGIAVDINASTNMPGTNGDMPKEVIFCFERHGFDWGGYWSSRDPMHFEYFKRS